MKHLKTYETISEDIKRGDILVDENDRQYESTVYLVLDDVNRSDRKINVFEIGNFKYDDFSFMIKDIHMGKKNTSHIYKGVGLRLVNEKEKLNIVKNIYSRIDNRYFVELLNNLKIKTGFDIRSIPEYVEHIERIKMENDAKKYNI